MAENKDHDGALREEQLNTLVHAVGAAAASRMPLEVTLAALADEGDDPRLADLAARLAARLQQGVPVDEAVRGLEIELPSEVRGLLRAGIESGDLAGTFERFAQQRLATQRIDRRIRAAVAYPLVIAAILVPVLLLLSLYIIPMFGELFLEFDLDLPGVTFLILHTAEQIPGLVVGLLLLVVAMPLVLRIAGGRWLFHRVRAATPLLGRLWMWSAQREFAAQLGSFLDQRLPLTSAVRHTGETMSDRNVGRACRRVSERLESGQPLFECLSQSMHFDRSLVTLVAWGERHNVLPEALRIAAAVYDDRIEQHASLVHRLLPPVALVAVAALVLFVVTSLMLPLIRLIEGLTR